MCEPCQWSPPAYSSDSLLLVPVAEGRGEGLVFVDEFAEVKDPVAISGQRMKWLLAVAKTLRQYYEGSLKTDTPGPGKVNSEAAVETAKRELAATMLQSIYMDYEKREKVDKKAADEKAAKQEGKGEDDALPAGGTGAVASAPSQSTTLRRQASSTGGQAAKEPGATPLRTASCIVCMEAFAGGVEPYKLSNCGHACVCAGCLTSMLNVKIDSRDVLPWIFCPAPNCKVAIHASDISSLVKAWPMYAMIQVYIHKLLARDNRWVRSLARFLSCTVLSPGNSPFVFPSGRRLPPPPPCPSPPLSVLPQTPCHNYQGSQAVDDSLAASSAIKPVFKCYYGFYLKDETEVREETCQVCSLKQTVKRSEALDEHFQRMVKEVSAVLCFPLFRVPALGDVAPAAIPPSSVIPYPSIVMIPFAAGHAARLPEVQALDAEGEGHLQRDQLRELQHLVELAHQGHRHQFRRPQVAGAQRWLAVGAGRARVPAAAAAHRHEGVQGPPRAQRHGIRPQLHARDLISALAPTGRSPPALHSLFPGNSFYCAPGSMPSYITTAL